MKSFADWTSEIAAANNPAPTALEVGEAIHAEAEGTISFEPYPIIEFKPENGTDWMRGAQWGATDLAVVEGFKPEGTIHWGTDTGRAGGDKTAVACRQMGKTATVMLIDEAARIDPEKLENLRRQYLGDWGDFSSERASAPIGSVSMSNELGGTHAGRVGRAVASMMAAMHDVRESLEVQRGSNGTRIRLFSRSGGIVHEVFVR